MLVIAAIGAWIAFPFLLLALAWGTGRFREDPLERLWRLDLSDDMRAGLVSEVYDHDSETDWR